MIYLCDKAFSCSKWNHRRCIVSLIPLRASLYRYNENISENRTLHKRECQPGRTHTSRSSGLVRAHLFFYCTSLSFPADLWSRTSQCFLVSSADDRCFISLLSVPDCWRTARGSSSFQGADRSFRPIFQTISLVFVTFWSPLVISPVVILGMTVCRKSRSTTTPPPPRRPPRQTETETKTSKLTINEFWVCVFQFCFVANKTMVFIF